MNTTKTKVKIFDSTFFITIIACIIPAFFGIAIYSRLPETMAIHWNFSGEPDNFAHKALSVFCLPLICAVLNAVCHIAVNFQRRKTGLEKESKLESVSKWICVAVSFFASSVTYLYALDYKFDIIKIVLVFCSLLFNGLDSLLVVLQSLIAVVDLCHLLIIGLFVNIHTAFHAGYSVVLPALLNSILNLPHGR